MTIDELQVLITANTNQLRKEIGNTQKDIAGLQKVADKSSKGITNAFKFLKTGIIALGIGKIIKDSIQSGMDAVENDSLFEVSMGKWADATYKWSDEMANALGLNANALRKTTGVIYNMTTSMGLNEENALKMSKGISMLTNDMASFYNLPTEEAFNKLRAGITGETEPLKALGILVDENTVKQVAYAEGIAQNGEELTQQQKVLARYVAILKQTGNAQGDLARTLDSPANQMRVFKSNLENLSIAFSNFLLPVLQAVMPYLNAFTKLITTALNSLARLMGFKGGSGGVNDTAKMSENVGGLGTGLDSADKKAKKLKGTLASFDEMNVLEEKDTNTGGGGAGGGGGGGGVGGLDGFDLSEYNAHLDWINGETEKVAENIKKVFNGVADVIKKVWNSEPVKAYVSMLTSQLNFVWELAKSLGLALWENLGNTWTNIEGNVMTTLTNITSLFTLFWTDMATVITEYTQPIVDGIVGLFNSIWVDAIDPLLQIMTKAWADFTGILLKLWQQYGKPLLENIGQFVTNTIALFQSIWDNVLEPIIKPFLEMLSWLWDKHLKGMVEEVGAFIMKLVNGALEIYNKFIQPILTWILDKLAPVFAYLGSLISGVFGSVFAVISDVIKNIMKVLGGIVDFITGILTGNWKKAWEGFVNIFKGIIDGIVSIFKFPINLIIDGINAFISGLNKLQIPDWVPVVGGKGLNIPKIPKLAKGGIIDRPTVAVVGEAGKEAVMPLENNTGWIDQLAYKIGALLGGGNNNNSQPFHLTINIGGDTVLDKFIDGVNDKMFEKNEVVWDL